VNALRDAGAKVEIVAPKSGSIRATTTMRRATRYRWTSHWTALMPGITTGWFCRAG
jgi:hypothetical protein